MIDAVGCQKATGLILFRDDFAHYYNEKAIYQDLTVIFRDNEDFSNLL